MPREKHSLNGEDRGMLGDLNDQTLQDSHHLLFLAHTPPSYHIFPSLFIKEWNASLWSLSLITSSSLHFFIKLPCHVKLILNTPLCFSLVTLSLVTKPQLRTQKTRRKIIFFLHLKSRMCFERQNFWNAHKTRYSSWPNFSPKKTTHMNIIIRITYLSATVLLMIEYAWWK